MKEISHATLLRAQAGQEDAILDLYQAIFRFVAPIVSGTTIAAEDVAQETFLKIFGTHDVEDRGPRAFAGWVKRVSVNEALGHLRRDKKYEPAEFETHDSGTDDDPAIDAFEALTRRQELQLAQAIIQNMSLPQRTVMTLRYGGDDIMEIDEIAGLLGTTRKAVEGHHRRAIQILREALHARSESVLKLVR